MERLRTSLVPWYYHGMRLMSPEETQEAIASAERLREELKNDPELRRAFINAGKNSLLSDEKRPTPKERYEQWVKETRAELELAK